MIYEYVYIRTSVSGFNEYTRKLIIFKKYREVPRLANIKSAKKRILVAQTKTLRNKMIKSAVKTAIKKVDAAIAANDKELAVVVSADILCGDEVISGSFNGGKATIKVPYKTTIDEVVHGQIGRAHV